MSKKTITLVFLFISLVTFLLGVWQLYRLDWKNELIQSINESISYPPEININNSYDQLTALMLNENFTILDKPIYLESKTYQGNTGYNLIYPLLYKNKLFSIINLGWYKDKNNNYQELNNLFKNFNDIKVYVRDFNSEKGFFIPKNEIAKNVWFSVIKKDLEEYLGEIFPSQYYFVIIDERINLYNLNPLVYLRNNHLNYSITWFLLSLSSAVMLLIIRRRNEEFKTSI